MTSMSVAAVMVCSVAIPRRLSAGIEARNEGRAVQIIRTLRGEEALFIIERMNS